jgi:hypothetical protein
VSRRRRRRQHQPGAAKVTEEERFRVRRTLIGPGLLAGAVVLVVVPALLLRPLSTNASFWLVFPASLASLICVMVARGASNARGQTWLDHQGRYLSAHTLTGQRSIDLRHLKSVRAYIVPQRYRPGTIYAVVTDDRGGRLTLSERDGNLPAIRRAVERQQQRPGFPPVTVTAFGRQALAGRGRRGAMIAWNMGAILMWFLLWGVLLGIAGPLSTS